MVILGDLLTRSFHLTAHYTDAGVMPRSIIAGGSALAAQSLHMLNGSTWFIAILFILTAIPAAMLILGYRSKPAALLCVVLMLSLHRRNPFLQNGGDHVLFWLLFWSMFLPLDSRWSLRRRAPSWGATDGPRFFSAASVCFILQLLLIYVVAGFAKTGPAWVEDYSGLSRILHVESFVTPPGRWLREYPAMMEWLTFGSILLERYGPVLVLIPFFNSWSRLIVGVSFILMHIGMALTMKLSIFPYVCMVAWVVLIPSMVWGRSTASRDEASFSADGVSAMPAAGGRLHPVVSYGLAVLMVYLVLLNVLVTFAYRGHALASKIVGNIPRLKQKWSVMAPDPLDFDLWYSAEARLNNGRDVDLIRLTDWDPSLAKQPTTIGAGNRWWVYQPAIAPLKRESVFRSLMAWLVRRWNRMHPDAEMQVESLTLLINFEIQRGENELPARAGTTIGLYRASNNSYEILSHDVRRQRIAAQLSSQGVDYEAKWVHKIQP